MRAHVACMIPTEPSTSATGEGGARQPRTQQGTVTRVGCRRRTRVLYTVRRRGAHWHAYERRASGSGSDSDVKIGGRQT